jgi:hypothetical protein
MSNGNVGESVDEIGRHKIKKKRMNENNCGMGFLTLIGQF